MMGAMIGYVKLNVGREIEQVLAVKAVEEANKQFVERMEQFRADRNTRIFEEMA